MGKKRGNGGKKGEMGGKMGNERKVIKQVNEENGIEEKKER